MMTLTACGGGTPHLGCEGRISGLPHCDPGCTAAIRELHDLRDALQVPTALSRLGAHQSWPRLSAVSGSNGGSRTVFRSQPTPLTTWNPAFVWGLTHSDLVIPLPEMIPLDGDLCMWLHLLPHHLTTSFHLGDTIMPYAKLTQLMTYTEIHLK